MNISKKKTTFLQFHFSFEHVDIKLNLLFQFNIAPVSVEGTKMSVLSDESRLYWTPAPPKFDVQPARVKDVLFPDYQPASLGMDPQEVAATRQMEEMEESSEEEEEMEMVDSAEERYQEIYR